MKHLHVITTQFDGHSKSVAASSSAPVPSILSQLAASSGQVDADAERERQWKLVQQERMRFVSFGVPKTWNKEGLMNCFRNSGKVFGHSGVLNASHRLFSAAADLFQEEGDDPWSAPTQHLLRSLGKRSLPSSARAPAPLTSAWPLTAGCVR